MDQNPQQSQTETTSTPPPGQAPMAPTSPYPRDYSVSQDDKSQAMLMWILSIFFGWVPALIFFLIAKDKPFVYRHSAVALTLTIVTFVAYMISIPLVAVLIGLLLLPIVAIFHIAIGVMGALAANKGDDFNPPIVGPLAKSMFKI